MSTDKTYQELLNKLIAGTISDKEKWQLEKASLDDPMLADALEGYYDNKTESNDLIALKEQLTAQPQSKTRSLPLRWMTIAASLLVLFSASFWFFSTTKEASDLSAEVAVVVDQAEKTIGGAVAKTQELKSVASKKAAEVVVNKGVEKVATKISVPTPTPSTPTPVTKTRASKVELADKADEQTFNNSDQELEEFIPEKVRRGNYASANETVEYGSKPLNAATRETTILEASEDMAMAEEEAIENQKSKSPKKEKIVVPRKGTIPAMDLESYAANSQGPGGVIPRPPGLVQGIITNERGIPMPGVRVMDTQKNNLTTTDSKGNFSLPEIDGYIITAFAGYDSMTVAISPNLSIQLQETSKTFSEPHKRLVDLMDDTELINHYKKELNSLFSKNWPICSTGWQGAHNNNPRSVSMSLEIDATGRLGDLHLYRDVTGDCRNNIAEILEEAERTIFESQRAISFIFRINL